MKENQYIEFKSRFSDAVIETLSAFANNKGGKVYIGVDDNGSPVSGFETGKETFQQWVNEIKNKTQPSIIPDRETVEFKGTKAVEICIQEYTAKPVSFKGRYYKRVKNSNHQLSLSEIADLHLKSFNSSWDYQLSNDFGLDTISLDMVASTIKRLNTRGFNIQEDPFAFLVKSDLVREGKLTRAAYLLFVNKP